MNSDEVEGSIIFWTENILLQIEKQNASWILPSLYSHSSRMCFPEAVKLSYNL